MHNTTDNHTYYGRQPASSKVQDIFDYVKANKDIKKVFDVGCNNGDMSYRLQKELGKNVLGVDTSDGLRVPTDYKYNVEDVTESNKVYYNDLTLFLSLYHHLLGAHGLQQADDIFFKLLLRTDRLIFDTGNVSEKARRQQYWFKEQKKHFQNEFELLNHFGIPYNTISKWDVAGGSRSLVTFDKSAFDSNVRVLETYKRYGRRKNQHKGLINVKDYTPPDDIHDNYIDNNGVYHGALFFKLQIADKVFFAKKHLDKNYEKEEDANIVKAYAELPPDKLLKYYGFSKKYGLIFEWAHDIVYKGKTTLKVGGKTLKDVDIIEVGGKNKYIDFHW